MKAGDTAGPLWIRLFGPFEARVCGQPLPRLRFRKSQVILALFVLRHGREYSRSGGMEREWLAGLLWPESAPSAALHNLRNCLTDLRRALGPEAGRLCSSSSRSLCLDTTGASVDVLTFDAALAREPHDPHGGPAALDEAVSVYRGPLLEGWTEEWVFQERQAREQVYLTAREKLAAHAVARGEPAAAERHLRSVIAADPLREQAQRSLMEVLAAGGNYAGALRAYQELRQHLHRALNAGPDPETQSLFQRLRAEAREKAGASRQTPDVSKVEPSAAAIPSAGLASGARVPTKRVDMATFPAPAGGENRLVTVLFAELGPSVEAVQGRDPEETAAHVSHLRGIVVEAILKFGGQVDRFLGDRVLAIFGMPQAHEDDAERAIRAALEIREATQRLGLPVTAGINTGMVYAGAVGTEKHCETTVLGPVVHLASGLQEQAGPGQILIGEATYHLTRRAFELSPHSLAAKGNAEPAVAYSVTRALARPEKARGIDGLQTPLIGREDELSKLQTALARVLVQGTAASARGEGTHGQIVSLIGEAGVGKSRLIAELKAQGMRDEGRGTSGDSLSSSLIPHPSSLRWLEGRCLELAATDRYSLFVDLLRHYFAWPAEMDEAGRVAPIAAAMRESAAHGALSAGRADEIGPLLADLVSLRWEQEHGDANNPTPHTLHPTPCDPEQRKQRTFFAIRDFLLALAWQQPLVLVLEDLHWADSLSLDLISLLMETLPRAPLFLLCSYRPDQEHRCSRLGTIAAQKCPESSTELRLRELTPLQSRQLVAALLGTRELPPPVKELILDRSRGNPFFMEELVHSLVERGVLYQEDGAWRIREEPARRPVPESVQGVILSRVDRLEPELKDLLQHAAIIGRVFHRRLLEAALEEGVGLDRRLWELEERGLIYQERVIPEEEYSFRHVLVQETVYEGILRSQRAGLHLHVAEAIERLYSERLDAYYERLAFHYEQASLPRLGAGGGAGECPNDRGLVPASGAVGATAANQKRALDYLIRAAERAHRTAAHREEAALLTRAIGMAERLGERDRIPDLRARRGGALARVGVWADARADLEAALERLAADRLERRARVLADLCTVSFWGLDNPGLRRYAPQALAVAEAAGRDDLAAGATAWLAETVRMEGKLVSARDLYRRAMVRGGGVRVAPLAGFPITLYMLGQIHEAVEIGRRALEAARGANDTLFTIYALSHLGLALGASGRYGEAMQIFAEARRFGHEYDLGPLVSRAIAMSAGLHLDVFDFVGNEALAEEVRDLPRSAAFPPSVVSAGIDLLLNFARRQEVGRAERLVDEVAGVVQDEKLAGRHGWQWKLRLAVARAEIALARTDWNEAARWAEEAIARSAASGRVKYQVAGLEARGKALAARGRQREGIAALQEAVILARPVGDPAMFVRAATALLELEGDGDLAAEARAAAKRIAAALPDEPMRRRFEAAEPVRLLGGLD